MGTNIGMMAGRRTYRAANSSIFITAANKTTISALTSGIWRGIDRKCGVVEMFGRKWHSQRLFEDAEGDIDTYFNANHFEENNEKPIVQFQESITTYTHRDHYINGTKDY